MCETLQRVFQNFISKGIYAGYFNYSKVDVMEIFESVNLKIALEKLVLTSRVAEEEETLNAFKNLFKADWECDHRIQMTLDGGANPLLLQTKYPLNIQNIYTLESIRSLCLKYRLRFLPSQYYKNEFPLQTIHAIKEIERELNTKIESYYLLAPAKVFHLEEANQDPLLFIPLSNGNFYLAHQWGHDLAWYRQIFAWPLRSLSTLLASIVLLSLAIALIVPSHFITESGDYFTFYRLILFVYSALSTAAITSYIWFATNGQLSSESWCSRYFN